MVNFRWTGYNTLIILAAMQAIPRDVYEAAIIDGASRLRTFFSVTIPMLRPSVIFVIITSTIGGLQIFDEPRLFDQLGQGGADRQWMTLTMFLYEVGWGPQRASDGLRGRLAPLPHHRRVRRDQLLADAANR
jgi:cellobiose transport system permease protein